MKAVIYARYSCDNQREESIDGQLRECKEFADKKGFTLVGTYIDRAVSAKTDNRPEFQRMIKESAKGLFDAVIVWKLDRFARNRYDSAHYKASLRKNGVKVISATEVISEGAEGIILESVLEGYAEYYSAELSEKVIRGMTENALKCQFNGGGVPVGYSVDEARHFHLDPLTAPFVKDAFEMYAGGRMIKDIIVYLNDKGVRSSQGKPMSKTSVTALLKNVKYKGQYKYRDILIDDGVPRIVSDELFQKAQERLEKNQQSRSRFKAKTEYFLSTKLICGDCGSFMIGESGTSRDKTTYNYYKCTSVKKHDGCHKKSVRKADIEEIVLNDVMEKMFTADMISDIADSVMRLQQKENTAVPLLQKQLDEVEKGIENMVNAMQMGMLTKSTKKRLDELEEQKEKLEADILREGIQQNMLSREQVILWLQNMKHLDLTNDDNKRRLVDTFVNSVYLYEDRAVVSFNCREGASTLALPCGGASACALLGEAKWTSIIIGIFLMIIGGLVILGGLKRIAAFAERVVPFMAVAYIIGCIIVFCFHISSVGPMFAAIFKFAFGVKAVAGGVSGIAIKQVITQGCKRGVFSNEAGLGSSVMVHSASNVREPVIQGMWGIFEVFMDTFVVCTMTAIVVLSSGAIDLETGLAVAGTKDATLVATAFGNVFGPLGSMFVALAVLLFAFTTVLGWSHYGTKSFEYLFGEKAAKGYKIFFVLMIVSGALMTSSIAWDISDTFNGFMMIPNLIGVISLTPLIIKLTQNYVDRRIKKKDVAPLLSFNPEINEEHSKDVEMEIIEKSKA